MKVEPVLQLQMPHPLFLILSPSKDARPRCRAPSSPREPDRFLRRAEERARFIQNFLVLGGGVAVSDDAAAGFHHHPAVLDDGGAQHDAGVHAAVAVGISYGAAIEGAAVELGLVDELPAAPP